MRGPELRIVARPVGDPKTGALYMQRIGKQLVQMVGELRVAGIKNHEGVKGHPPLVFSERSRDVLINFSHLLLNVVA